EGATPNILAAWVMVTHWRSTRAAIARIFFSRDTYCYYAIGMLRQEVLAARTSLRSEEPPDVIAVLALVLANIHASTNTTSDEDALIRNLLRIDRTLHQLRSN